MCFVQCMIKQLLDSVCDIQNNQGLGKGYEPLRLITPTSTLIILHITKTSSNNCLMYDGNQGEIDFGSS